MALICIEETVLLIYKTVISIKMGFNVWNVGMAMWLEVKLWNVLGLIVILVIIVMVIMKILAQISVT